MKKLICTGKSVRISTQTPILEEIRITLEAALHYSEDGDLCSSQDLMREALESLEEVTKQEGLLK